MASQQKLAAAESAANLATKQCERTAGELQQEKAAAQSSALREKSERKQWKRLWSETVDKLKEEKKLNYL